MLKNPSQGNSKETSSMGGLSRINMMSNMNLTTRTKDYSGMGGLSKIHPQSELKKKSGNIHQSIGMGGLSRMQLNSELGSKSASYQGMGGLSRMQLNSEYGTKSTANYRMGGLSKINIDSEARSFQQNKLNNSRETTNSKTQSHESFKRAEINFGERMKHQSDIRSSR